jgi:hypothetical protein
MDVIALVEKYRKCSTKEAINWLKAEFHIIDNEPVKAKPSKEQERAAFFNTLFHF